MVFPKPISSASTAPSPKRRKNSNHDVPCCWYGRSSPKNCSGVELSGISLMFCSWCSHLAKYSLNSSSVSSSSSSSSSSQSPCSPRKCICSTSLNVKPFLRCTCLSHFFTRAISSADRYTHCSPSLTNPRLPAASSRNCCSLSSLSPSAKRQSNCTI